MTLNAERSSSLQSDLCISMLIIIFMKVPERMLRAQCTMKQPSITQSFYKPSSEALEASWQFQQPASENWWIRNVMWWSSQPLEDNN